MRTTDKFPWEFLKAECLRLVCVQLIEGSGEGHNPFRPGRKDEMIAFLQDVHQRGVLKALQNVEPPKTPKRSANSAQATPSKRKSPVDRDEDADGETDNEGEEGYNTRFKGVKRVKVHGPTPEPPEPKPRRKINRLRKSLSGASPVDSPKRGRPRKEVVSSDGMIKVSRGKGKPLEDDEAIPPTPRARGRPRKSETENAGVSKRGPAKKHRLSTNGNVPKSREGGREVFDGILLVKRRTNGREKANGDDEGDVGDDDIDGEGHEELDGFEEDAVLAAVNGDVQGDLSSLGGSNKENEMTYDLEEGHEADMDADGEFEADAEV